MAGIRALQRRVKRMEQAEKPRPSPIVRLYGSFDIFLNIAILPGYLDGSLDQTDMDDLVAIFRAWETDGTWERARAG